MKNKKSKIGFVVSASKVLCFVLLAAGFYSTGSAQVKNKRSPAKQLYPLQIIFENRVDTNLLHLDSAYINPHGEAFTVKNFRYYISQLSIIDGYGKIWPTPYPYLLIDERKEESKAIRFNLPFRKIGGISFSIGVDSSKNVNGVQTGALDPANGMFWTWNSGYIFAKLEGSSPVSTAPQNGFTYHIGGYRTGENAMRKVTKLFKELKMLSNQTEEYITVEANINNWFEGKTSISIAAQPSTMNPGKLAMQIADNYSRMFSIIPTN